MIYCSDCKNLGNVNELKTIEYGGRTYYEFYKTIKFFNSDEHPTDSFCYINLKRNEAVEHNPIRIEHAIEYTVSDPMVINKNNDCKFFDPTISKRISNFFKGVFHARSH
jgi:hypothetical protein